VEYHLRHTYQKLDIGSRTQLATALAATNSDAEDRACHEVTGDVAVRFE